MRGKLRTLVVQVNGAPDAEAARSVGLAVASSPLVKTALFGGPRPGRFPGAGRGGVPFDGSGARGTGSATSPSSSGDGSRSRAGRGRPARWRAEVLRVDLNGGPGEATVFGCDLSHDYVDINSRYTT
jgi:glutamate N-acetyltransferase/amino-acid N-acetyltransferase